MELRRGSRAAAALALLAALLGAGAPLAHAHLDAAAASAAGLCGEHHAPAEGAPDEHCSLCLAGSGARAALAAPCASLAAAPLGCRAAALPAPAPPRSMARAPGGPRAPPLPA